jgi:hypothetical protein
MRLSGIVSVRFERWIPRLVIIDKFERPVKYSLWIVTAVAIISSVFVFPRWYYALACAIVLFALQQFLQRVVFQYVSIYIQPLPAFKFDVADWTAMAYGFPEKRGVVPDIVTPAFRTAEIAKQFMELLRQWNNGEDEDREDNIRVSLVFETEDKYRCFIYPNPQRARVKEFHESIKSTDAKHRGKEHLKLVVQMMFMRTFPYDSTSSVVTFIQVHREGDAFDIRPAVWNGGALTIMSDIPPITKWHIKIRERSDLEPSDLEYNHPL